MGSSLHTIDSFGVEPFYVSIDERHVASGKITLARNQMKTWPVTNDTVHAYCFFHAAHVAQVDGHWYAINGIARTGLDRHWIENDGERKSLEDGDDTKGGLRDFLYAVNDKMNDACP